MRTLALLAVLTASPAVGANVDADRDLAAERLSSRALDTLDGVLGPGRAKVHVEVQGERSEISTESEIVTPMERESATPIAKAAASIVTRSFGLPGYARDPLDEIDAARDKSPAPPLSSPTSPPFYQKDHEQSRHDAGFKITSIQATVVLDSALEDALVREVSQLLPQVLKIDTTRGDTLSILRAPLKPAWKTAFATPSDWRSAAYAVGGGLVILLAAAIGGVGLVGAGGALGRELARGRAAEPPSAPLPEGEPLPELTEGAPPGLLNADAAPGTGSAAPMLGRRFDFLSSREPDLIARALASEKPEDLSLFFGHLSESIPDLASRLFAHLPASLQAEVSQSLVKLNIADPERLGAIEERLRLAVENGVMGAQSLGRILSRVPSEARTDLLSRLAERDRGAVEEVERHLFSFEDLSELPPAQIRRLLGALPYDVWGLALRGAPEALANQVLADLPEGPRELVRGVAATPQPREKIVEARSKILDALAELTAKGEVTVGRSSVDGDLV